MRFSTAKLECKQCLIKGLLSKFSTLFQSNSNSFSTTYVLDGGKTAAPSGGSIWNIDSDALLV